MTHDDQIACPCCGDPMIEALVVCWDCYRITNRLEADIDHIHESGTTTVIDRYGATAYAVHVTSAQVAKWDNERNARQAK